MESSTKGEAYPMPWLRYADPQRHGHADDAFIADHSDFQSPALIDCCQQTDETVDGKVGMPNLFHGLIKHLRVIQLDWLEAGQHALIRLPGHGSKQMVCGNEQSVGRGGI